VCHTAMRERKERCHPRGWRPRTWRRREQSGGNAPHIRRATDSADESVALQVQGNKEGEHRAKNFR
jgi:hypothetical protein